MQKRDKHYRLGVFILTGIGLLVALLVFLGSGALFQQTVPAESYFNESVQGLDVGAPVKYRGVKIGTVSFIGFIVNKYPQAMRNAESRSARYVLVEMEIDEKQLENFFPVEHMPNLLDEVIKTGLRIRLTTQGLTGVAFLEMNFFDPETNPTLPISWKPEDVYIPSAPSTLSRLEDALDAVGGVMRQLQSVDFGDFAKALDEFFRSLTKAMNEANVKNLGELLVQNLTETRNALRRVNELLATPKVETILPDVSDAAAGVKKIVLDAEPDVAEAVRRIREMADSLQRTSASLEQALTHPEFKEALRDAPQVMEDVRQASAEFRRFMVQLERVSRNVDSVVTTNRPDLDVIIDELRALLVNLNELTTDVKQNPSRVLFGAPPQPIDTERQK